MAIYIDVTLNGGPRRPKLGDGPSKPILDIPRLSIRVALDATGDWYFTKPLHPYWRYFAPDNARGKWYKDSIGSFILNDLSGRHLVFEFRSSEKCQGLVNYWPRAGNRNAILYDGAGWWKPTDTKLPKTWAGFMIKGGGGAGVSAELGFGAVMQLWGGNTHGCSFSTRCGRLGAVAGLSGGLAFVYATGFDSARDFDNFGSDGWDFALAVGTKLGGVLSPQWSRVAGGLGKFDGGIGMLEKVVQGANPKYAGLRGELPGLAKSISQGVLVDADVQNITTLDLPMCGGGAEAGVFYGWSRTNLLSSW